MNSTTQSLANVPTHKHNAMLAALDAAGGDGGGGGGDHDDPPHDVGEALDYDEWFRVQVELGRRSAARGELVPNSVFER